MTSFEKKMRKINPEKINWAWVCRANQRQLSESFLREYADYIDWYEISSKRTSKDFTREFDKKFDWSVKTYSFYTSKDLEEFKRHEDLDWNIISSDAKLTEKFITVNSEKVNWEQIFYSPHTTNKFCVKNIARAKYDDLREWLLELKRDLEKKDENDK